MKASTARWLSVLVMLTPAMTAAAVDAKALAQVATRANQGLPKMIAGQLRMDRVETSGMTLTHLYTHVGKSAAQLRDMRLESTQRPYILPSLCADAATGRMLREGVRFRYVYRGSDGGVGGDLTLSKADC